MRPIIFITGILFGLVTQLPAQNYSLQQIESDASCFTYNISDAGGNSVELPADIRKHLECPSVIAIRENILILYADNNLIWFDIEKKTQTVLVKLYPDIDGVSNPTWSSDGKRMLFVVINQERKHDYKEFCRLLVLDIDASGKVLAKQKFDKKVNFSCGSICTSVPGEDFKFKDDNTIEFKRHELIEDRPGEWETIQLK